MKSRLLNASAMLVLLALSFVCFSKARADVPFYLGDKAFKQKNWDRALPLFREALRRDFRDPQTLSRLGQAAYEEGMDKNRLSLLEESESVLARVTVDAPYDAKAWLYLALVKLEKVRREGALNREHWAEIQALLEKAQGAEPGNSWIAYIGGKTILTQEAFLSADGKKRALDWIRKSASLHNPYQASPYLDPAIAFLWERFSDFTLLKMITPLDLFSYARLAAFVESKELWEYRDEINPFYLKLNEALYEDYADLADKFLKKKDYKHAYVYYDKAVGVNNVRVHAKAGLLVTQEKLGLLPADWKKTLREVLEEEQDPSGNSEALAPLVEKSQDAYLRGLHAYRSGDYMETRKVLEKADGQYKFRRRYLADAAWKTGDKAKALAIARGVLEEKDPDLRELLAYESWDSPLREEMSEKITKTATVEQLGENWQGAGFRASSVLDRRGRMRVYVNLKPGPVVFHIQMKSKPGEDGQGAYAALHVWDADKVYHLRSLYFASKELQTVDFPFETKGGSRALEMELMNGASVPGTGPVLELGTVKIEYPNG